VVSAMVATANWTVNVSRIGIGVLGGLGCGRAVVLADRGCRV
jgi:hypothetical protein